jgi:hypothetical protein
MRSALAYPKLVSASALGSEKGAWHTRPPAGLNALRAGIPKTGFSLCLRVRKGRLAYAVGSGVCFAFLRIWAHFLLRKKPGFAGVPPLKRPLRAPTIPCAEEAGKRGSACRMCQKHNRAPLALFLTHDSGNDHTVPCGRIYRKIKKV